MNGTFPDFGLDYVTPDHYAGFGMIVQLTCHLDALLDQAIVAMTNTANHPTFYPLLTFLSAKDKRDYIEAIAKESSLPPYAIKGFLQLLKGAKTAFALRNDIAHCVWRKGRRPGTIKPMSLSARGVMKVLGSGPNEREWTADQLIQEAEKLHELGTNLGKFMHRYGLIPPLPKIPPQPDGSPPRHRRDKPSPDG